MTVAAATIAINPRLHWGEWLGIAATRIAVTVIAAQIVFIASSAVWFGDIHHVLLGPAPLAASLIIAAGSMRLFEVFPRSRRVEPTVLVVGIIVTALILIRRYAFSALPPGDWSWLNSYRQLGDPVAELPHTELGMIAISIMAWTLGTRIARYAGDYDKQRAAFTGNLVLIISAIVLAIVSVHGIDPIFGGMLALALPAYLFVGLLTLSQVRLAAVRERLTVSGGGDRRSLAIWRITTVAFALLSLMAIVIMGIIFYTGSYLRFIGAFFDFLTTVLALAAEITITLLLPLTALLHGGLPGLSANGCSSAVCAITAKNQPIDQVTVHVTFIGIIIVGLVAAVVLTLVLLRRLLRRSETDEFEEIQEHLSRDLQRARRGVTVALPEDVPAAGTVRAIYRDFLGKSATLAWPVATMKPPPILPSASTLPCARPNQTPAHQHKPARTSPMRMRKSAMAQSPRHPAASARPATMRGMSHVPCSARAPPQKPLPSSNAPPEPYT